MAELREVAIAPPPGVVKSDSLRVLEGRWSDTINMRFVKTKPQKIGGWTKRYTAPTFGTPRSLHAWRDTFFNAFMGVGTYVKLYVYDQNASIYDATPFRATGTLTNPISTTAGSSVMTVVHTAHGVTVGDLVFFSSFVTGGINLQDYAWEVQSIVDANTYTAAPWAIAYPIPPTFSTTVSNVGGTLSYAYEVPVGVELGTYGYGYGVMGYGLETYDVRRSQSTIRIEPRIWSIDHFGTLMIASYNGGSLYKFDPTLNLPWSHRATLLSSDPGMPTVVRAMFVTPERFIMALCENMQVAWPSQGTIDVWTPAITNTANIRTLTEGTKLVGGKVLADFVSLIWTDAAVYRFQYTGATYIYASSMVAKDCGLVSPNAAVTIGGVAYWMGQDNFWTYNGTVMPMPNVNDIRKWVFDDVDVNLSYQASASYNPVYNEIWFFFSIAGQTNPTRGLIYSIDEQCWAPLYWGRAGGTHFTQGDTRPVFGSAVVQPGTAANFYIYQHETGNDDDGSILPYSMTLAPYGLTKGGLYNMHVEYMVPDFFQQVGAITLTVDTWDRLNDSQKLETETETIGVVDTGTIDLRINGRYIALTAGASLLGSYARLGQPVAFVRSTGSRT